MKRLLMLVCGLAVGISLSAPVMAQPAAKGKEKVHAMHAKGKGATEGKKVGQEGAKPATKSEGHKKHSTKAPATTKGSTEGKKVGTESTTGKKPTKDARMKN